MQKLDREPNIKVFVRVRPFNDRQKQIDLSKTVECTDGKLIHVTNFEGSGSVPSLHFSFDKVFDWDTPQRAVYEHVAKDIINSAFCGINGTIFCYGQTASGKTHTCLGTNIDDEVSKGFVPRIIETVLTKNRNCPLNIDSRAKLSIVEIYNENVTDLLNMSHRRLKLRQNRNKGVFLEGVTEKYVSELEEGLALLKIGIDNRAVGSTQMNAISSRSHVLFMLTIDQNDFSSGEARTAKLTVIDLAGSEKISKTGTEGKMLEEAIKINTSLSALGNVIHALSEGRSGHVPYRDSKLTRLLQESLGGNSLTSLIVNISPSVMNESETVTALRFGHRAKAIKNSPKINKQYTVEQLLILLEKAQLKIKTQNKVIEDLSKARRDSQMYFTGDKITLHILKDEEEYSESNADSRSVLSRTYHDQYDGKNPIISPDQFKRPLLRRFTSMNMKISQRDECTSLPRIDGSPTGRTNSPRHSPGSPHDRRKSQQSPNTRRLSIMQKIDLRHKIKEIVEQPPDEDTSRNSEEMMSVNRGLNRTRSQAALVDPGQEELAKENMSLRCDLQKLKTDYCDLKEKYARMVNNCNLLRTENKLKMEILARKNQTIEKLKSKNQQRKMDMEKDITILKNLWQTFAGSASDKENMSKGSIKEGMTESNCAIERNCVTDYTCATGQNCGTEQNCGTDQSIVGESTP